MTYYKFKFLDPKLTRRTMLILLIMMYMIYKVYMITIIQMGYKHMVYIMNFIVKNQTMLNITYHCLR